MSDSNIFSIKDPNVLYSFMKLSVVSFQLLPFNLYLL